MDPVWRLTHLYQIRTKVPGHEGQTVTFSPNRPQRKLFQAIEDGHKRIIVLKGRKLGTTTACCLYLLDKSMFSSNQFCQTIAHRKQTVIELFNDPVRFTFDRIPKDLRPRLRYSTRSELDFPDLGSKYSVDVEARGKTPTYLHISEVAYIDDTEKLEDTIESLPLGAVGIVESTANGKGNWFHKTFERNMRVLKEGGEPEWYPLFFAWFDDPINRYPSEGKMGQLRYEKEARELQSKYNLSDDQIYFWDRKRFQLGERMPELYPSTAEEAFRYSTGRVYDEFDEDIHVIPEMRFPEFRVAFDWGQTNPMVVLLIAQDQDNNFIVFDEFYETECPIPKVAKWMHDRGIKKVDYPDPSIFNRTQFSSVYRPGQSHRYSIADEFRRHGIIMVPNAQNDIPAGLVRVKEYLAYDILRTNPFRANASGGHKKGSPRLFITENCTETKREFYNYRWPERPSGSTVGNEREVPRKENDHAMDALRYAILSWARPLSKDEDAEIVFGSPAWVIKNERLDKKHREQQVY